MKIKDRFLNQFGLNVVRCHNLLVLLKHMLNLLYTVSIKGRELYACDFAKFAFIVGLCSYAYEMISVKLNMMLDWLNSTVWY